MIYKELLTLANPFTSVLEVDGPDELWVPAGKIYAVPVHVSSTGVMLCWEFTTLYKVLVSCRPTTYQSHLASETETLDMPL